MQDETSKSVGQRIREARRAKGLTLEQLAAALEMDQSSLSRLETGAVRCYVDVVLAVAEALDVDPVALLVPSTAREREASAAVRLGGSRGAKRLMQLALELLEDE